MSRDRRRERGMTVIEALVATLVFSVVFLAALGLYQAANKAYMATDAATIQQQNIRFAMDRIGDSIRGSGADYNTAGLTTIPDEQIEGAWEGAIVVRGNYNDARETTLEDATHPIVTTGNDEIVGYVLRKPGFNTMTINIKADLTPATGRDGAIDSTGAITGEETSGNIAVAAVSLADQTNPPYQLTKVTFDPSGNPKYSVVADNIFRMSFTYFDSSGTAVALSSSADADRGARASVRQIDVKLIGLADRPDFGFTDPTAYTPAENADTTNRHKFTLAEHFVPPNLGKIGRRHSNAPALSIAAPVSITACVGHCRYYHLTWPATTTPGITQYMIDVSAPAAGTAPALHVNTLAADNAVGYDYMQPDSVVRAYTFMVAGVYAGIPGTFSVPVTTTATNQLAPSPPTALSGALGASGNTIDLTWTAPTTSAGTLSGSVCTTAGAGAGSSGATAPWSTAVPDLSYYKVFRVRNAGGATSSFTTSASNEIDGASIGPLQNVLKPQTTPFTDNLAAPCTSYFYKVQACDLCDSASADSAGSAATSFDLTDPSVVPAAPATLNGVRTISGSNYTVVLNWSPVTQTAPGDPAATAHYIVNREQKLGTGAFTAYPLTTPDVFEATTLTDTVPMTVGGLQASYRYTVQAQYDCASPRIGGYSPAYVLACAPAGTLSITNPAAGTDWPRPYVTQVIPALAVTGTGWTGAHVDITGPSGTLMFSQDATGAGPYTFNSPAWDISNSTTTPDGTYTITATATAGSCVTNPVSQSFTLSTNACGLQIVSASYTHTTGANAFQELDFQIQNTCLDTNLTIDHLQPSWTVAQSGLYITQIQYSGSNISNLLTSTTGANGVNILLTSPQTITANTTTSSKFSFFFSSNFTSDGTKSGSPGQFMSIIAHETAPSPSGTNDELVATPPIP